MNRPTVLALCFWATLQALPANAGIIFLSGDSNLGNALDGSSGAPVTAGNSTFFNNVLGTGTTVKIQDEGYSSASPSVKNSTDAINAYYSSLGGVTSTLFLTTTIPSLAGVDLFISILPSDSYTAAEITVLSGFVNGGGSLFFMGENSSFTTQNNRINAALSALGVGMSILNTLFDGPGFHTATGGQIATDPFTTGISSFTYAASSAVSTLYGGNVLFFGTGGEAFLAYVPEPSTLALATLGLLGMGYRRRKLA